MGKNTGKSIFLYDFKTGGVDVGCFFYRKTLQVSFWKTAA